MGSKLAGPTYSNSLKKHSRRRSSLQQQKQQQPQPAQEEQSTMSLRFARASLLHDYLLHNTSYRSLLPPEERRCRDRRLPRCSIRKYKYSPFKYMYDIMNDQALLNTTGLDHRTFQELLNLYEPFFKKYMWDKKKKMVWLMKVDKFG